MKTFLCLLLLAVAHVAIAQVAINNDASQPDPSAMLDIKSTNKGLLVPRTTQAMRTGISNPAMGLMIYQTDGAAGYYYNAGSSVSPAWMRLGQFTFPFDTTVSNTGYSFIIKNTANSAIQGISSAPSGNYFGLYGRAEGTSGRGVWGFATSGTGETVGVGGGTSSSQGIGVQAIAGSATGTTYGVKSSISSPDGYSGHFSGGRFYVIGNVGLGVLNPTATLDIAGTVKIADGNQSAGKVLTCDAVGLAAWQALPDDGLNLPYAKSVLHTTDYAFKVTNSGNSAIQGISSAASGAHFGLYGITYSTSGRAVWGYATSSTGSTIAVGGGATSSSGTALYGIASSSTGTTYGVQAIVSSPDGYSGYFSGGQFYISGNTGIGTPDPTAKLEVAGQVKITGGSPAAGKVLNSDANGLATWDYAPGSIIKYTILNSSCYSVATFSSSAYTKIADIGTFSKVHAGSDMEVTFQGSIWAQTMAGTGAHFELRVDGVATTNGRARANLRNTQAGGVGEYVSITGLFTGLGTGSHTVSMWIIGAAGNGTNGGLDPGCWGDDRVVIKEVR